VIDGTFVATNAGGPSPIGLAPGTYTLDRAEGRVEPKITLAVQVTPWLQPYVTYSEALRVPTVQESQLGGDHPGGARVAFYPNPYLNPELLKGWELGANVKANGLLVGVELQSMFDAKTNIGRRRWCDAELHQMLIGSLGLLQH
jgi:outer membrane receptor protein involved in Fe transport